MGFNDLNPARDTTFFKKHYRKSKKWWLVEYLSQIMGAIIVQPDLTPDGVKIQLHGSPGESKAL
jgi:hypothetical protein